jgi:hypothetical protein
LTIQNGRIILAEAICLAEDPSLAYCTKKGYISSSANIPAFSSITFGSKMQFLKLPSLRLSFEVAAVHQGASYSGNFCNDAQAGEEARD